MENFAALLIPALLAVVLVRLLMIPMKWGLRLALHAGSGFVCLWMLNTASGFTGVLIPINAVTVLAAGFLGIPGMGLLALLEVMG